MPPSSPTESTHVRIAIIGAGFSGLGLAIRLRQRGDTDFVVLDRADGVGGVWRANTYPGCACDVPSNLYSFSFAPNPGWSRTFSKQPEICAYLEDCAERFDLGPHLRFGCTVEAAVWDAPAAQWRLQTSQGPLSADFLVAANGALAEPSTPDIPGLERFDGPVVHSARWDPTLELDGKRVALIGTGASGVQIAPAVQPVVERLDVYQRTPAWVWPRLDRPFTRLEHAMFRMLPWTQRLSRALIYTVREAYVVPFTRAPRMMRGAASVTHAMLRLQVRDADKRARLTPSYEFGCKRILLANDYYPALDEPNVDVVTDGIQQVVEDGIVSADGTHRPADVVALATGFHVVDNPFFQCVRGTGDRSVADAWTAGVQTYLGTLAPGFPNLFVMTGPNTGLGHSSMVYMIESQLAYVLGALDHMAETGRRSLEVRRDVADAWNADLQARLGETVWSSGCRSWYLDPNGRNVTLWPGFTWEFRRETRRFDPEVCLLR